YSYQGKVYHDFPPHQTIFHKCVPEYLEIPGWGEEISGAKKKEELPDKALKYIGFVEQAAGVPVDVVSVGPGRTQTVWMREGIEPPKLEEGPYLNLEEFEPPNAG
ncbi:MAG: adenylosuccinate synthetase, partial [Actinobacteria bacterium]|nr:adenylosuccinate synthetase [Actinomycetota bacterium]